MSKRDSGLGKFLLGAAVGVTVGILFAPKKGSETRKELGEKIKDLCEKVKEVDIQEVKDNISVKITELKHELKDLDKEKALALAKKKGAAIKKKADELVVLAKEKGTPVLEKAANDVREKAIEVVKDVLDKLENPKKAPAKKTTKKAPVKKAK